jgi:hypothetical protein
VIPGTAVSSTVLVIPVLVGGEPLPAHRAVELGDRNGRGSGRAELVRDLLPGRRADRQLQR